jgi:hypothetical protein
MVRRRSGYGRRRSLAPSFFTTLVLLSMIILGICAAVSDFKPSVQQVEKILIHVQ